MPPTQGWHPTSVPTPARAALLSRYPQNQPTGVTPMNILTYRRSPDGGHVLALRRPGRAGLLRWCAALWHTRRIRRSRERQRAELRHALPWMAASGAVTPAIYGRGNLGRRP